MSESEHASFEPATASGSGGPSLVEPEGVNAGSADAIREGDGQQGAHGNDPVSTDVPRARGRHVAEQTPRTEPGSQDLQDGEELLGAPATEAGSGQDSGSMD